MGKNAHTWIARILVGGAIIVIGGAIGYWIRSCQDTNQIVQYDLSGTLRVAMSADVPCDGDIPATVKMTVKIVKGTESVAHTQTVDSNGDFSILVNWLRSKGTPDYWIVDNVARTDGSPICEHPSMGCPEGAQCVDTVRQHVRGGFDPVNNVATETDHEVMCGCR